MAMFTTDALAAGRAIALDAKSLLDLCVAARSASADDTDEQVCIYA